ncbi:MAG: NAD(+) diphosphatase [Actinomycetota bacterium]
MTAPLPPPAPAIDRAHGLRADEAWTALVDRPATRFYPYWKGLQLLSADGGRAAWLDGDEGRRAWAHAARRVFLGRLDDGTALMAFDTGTAGEAPPAMDGRQWASLRAVGAVLLPADAALLAYARGVLEWHARTRFCPQCGGALSPSRGGHVLTCCGDDCHAEHYPRTDPAIIVMVTDGADRVLLGRQPAWPPGMWSCLAGFVEPGETLEHAVAREVAEETGIAVADVAYAGSQPWPFPASLMVGFAARAVGGRLEVDRNELEDARWFDRADLATFGESHAPGPTGLFLPRSDTIARMLIERWLGR